MANAMLFDNGLDLFIFNEFCHQIDGKFLRKQTDHFDDGFVFKIFVQSLDDLTINFEIIRTNLHHFEQIGVTNTEVINGNFHAIGTHFLDEFFQCFHIGKILVFQ